MTGLASEVQGDDEVLILLDISRAHLHSQLARVLFVTIHGKGYPARPQIVFELSFCRPE